MSGGPTDFNDQAAAQGAARVRQELEQALAAILEQPSHAEGETTTNQLPAQLFEGENPVGEVAENAPPPESPPENAARHREKWRDLLERNKEGNLKGSVKNTELVLRNDEAWRGVLAYCDLSYRIIKRLPPPIHGSEEGEWQDADKAALRVWFAHHAGFTPSHVDIDDALLVVARANRFHPVRDYLEGLRWDGVPRLEHWLERTFESTDDEDYLKLVGKRVLIGAVARVMRPGCKMDNVMILEGQQGKGKSTAIAILFGEWFADSPIPIGDKEAYQQISGKWGYELGELDSFNKAEITTLKQFFSQQTDRFRPSYGRYAQDFPRQTQFWGTTNQDVYLRDYTGNRRFWPVYCKTVNKDWLRAHRDLLWAEALHRYRAGEKWWISQETPDEEAEARIVEEAQDARLQRDAWEDLLGPYLANLPAGGHVTSAEILMGCLKFDAAHIQQAHMNRLAPLMKALGWKSTRKRFLEGKTTTQRRVWVRDGTPDTGDQVISPQNDDDEVPL